MKGLWVREGASEGKGRERERESGREREGEGWTGSYSAGYFGTDPCVGKNRSALLVVVKQKAERKRSIRRKYTNRNHL